jgi:hypothetical protein
LTRTLATLARVRALYERTHSRILHTGMVIEDWRLTQDRMVGTYRVRRLGRDVRETIVLGPLTFEQGVRGGVYWQQNRNGISFTYTGFHEQRDAISDRAWETGSTRNVRLIGESPAFNAYVVEINPPGGRHEWLFVDRTNGNVVRTERVQKRRRFVATFDDFRLFDGMPEPSHVKSSDSFGNDRERFLLSRTLDLTADPRDLDIPSTRRTLVEFPIGTTLARLPVRIVNGLLVLPVAIGARTYDFLLDTGAAGIVVDPSIIGENKLERYGTRVGATIGTFSETTSIVPMLGIGPLRMHNIVVRVVNVPFVADERTHIAGLLGFDFFADAVVHVDFERGIVSAIAPGSFHASPDAVTVPLALDDKTPDVRARVGGAFGRIVLDTGANRSVFTTAFASRADFGATDPATNSRFRGMGGTGTAETVRIKDFELAGLGQSDPLVDISNADFDAEDVDGTAGTDLLRPYDLFFDYRASALYVRRTRPP